MYDCMHESKIPNNNNACVFIPPPKSKLHFSILVINNKCGEVDGKNHSNRFYFSILSSRIQFKSNNYKFRFAYCISTYCVKILYKPFQSNTVNCRRAIPNSTEDYKLKDY